MRKLLIVEDDVSVLAAMSVALRGKYSIVESRDVDQALAKWKSDAPDAIITDLALPSRDGLELIQFVRRTDETIPIIATTGMRKGYGVLSVANQLGANAVLCKPFSATELLSIIESVLKPMQ